MKASQLALLLSSFVALFSTVAERPPTELRSLEDALTITNIILVNSETNQDIRPLQECNGCVTPFDPVNVRATVAGPSGSARLTITGPLNYARTEGVEPYALFGDVSGDYYDRYLGAGEYTVTAQAFGLDGTEGPIASATFRVAPSNTWIEMDESTDYTARHECSFVQAGDKFYMFGGREKSDKLDIYDYASNSWSVGAMAPELFNHFQATEYEGLIWVIGAFVDNDFPNESPAEYLSVYDPANNVWMQGLGIPRQRGGGGLIERDGKFYLLGGNTMGHDGDAVAWFDEYDPHRGVWRVLPDAPHTRDHFHAILVGHHLYAIGGRRTKKISLFTNTVAEVDVYDFSSGNWLVSNLPPDLPSPRAAAAVALFDGKIMIMGGESGEQGEAFARVDALDVATGSWESLSPMNHGRHGTQAIISGQGVYIAGGSPNRGGGNQLEMEVYNADAPAGSASTAGVLSDPFEAEIFIGASQSVRIEHVGGTQGVFVQSIALGGPSASDFKITSNIVVPLLIGRGGLLDMPVEFTGTIDGAQAWLDVSYSGNQNLRITLIGKLPSTAPTGPVSPPTKMPVIPPTPGPTPADPLAISDIILVDSTTNSDIVSLLHDSCNGCIGPSDMINIRAVTIGDSESARLTISGPVNLGRTENAAPYALFGDISGNYFDQILPAGDYTVKAQAFSSDNMQGTAGPIKSVNFTVLQEPPPVAPPSQNQSPTKMPVVSPTPEPTPTDPLAIGDIILVNSTTNNDIVSLLYDSCNGCIGPSDMINIRAVTIGYSESARLTISGPVNLGRTENAAPYALFGDISGNYFDQILPAGDYTVKTQAFSSDNMQGTAGPVKSVNFTVSA